MSYYLYNTDPNRFASVGFSPADTALVESVFWQDGPLKHRWTPVECHGFHEGNGEAGDFPSLASLRRFPVFSSKALATLWPLLEGIAEALPIAHEDGRQLFLVHMLFPVDCLDIARCQVRRYATDGKIAQVHSYAFAAKPSAPMLRLPVEQGSDVIVGPEFKRIVEAAGLRGLRFSPLRMAQ